MSRPKAYFDDTYANVILKELRNFSGGENTIANGMRPFYRYMTNAPNDPHVPGLGYEMTWGEFRYYWNELRVLGYIQQERTTGAFKVAGVKVLITAE